MTSLRISVAVPVAALASLALAGCIPPADDAPPPPQPEPVVTAEPEPVAPPPVVEAPAPPHGNWMDAPVTPGDWRWRAEGGESFAEFVTPGGELLVQFNCTADRDMVLAITNRWPEASGVQVRTETRAAVLTTSAREGWVETRLDAADTLLDAIAFSRGRFALEVRGGAALYVPSYPEITRVVEDCRA